MSIALVTGASGYIGSCVVQKLLKQGHEVIATARKATPKLATELGVEKVETLDVLAIGETVDWRADLIIHCATANDILSRRFNDGIDLSVNGTWNVLELAKKVGAKQVIFLSTFQVYGTELQGSINESTPVKCETPYALNHWFGEEACRLQVAKGGIPVAVLRPANVYGTPVVSTVDRSTLVPMCFVQEALEKQQITLKSSGRQNRNFVSVHQVADACAHFASNPATGFEIFNVCTEWETSMREIASLTAEVYQELFGRNLPVEILSDHPLEANVFHATSSLAPLAGENPVDDARDTMKNEIRKLFTWFQNR